MRAAAPAAHLTTPRRWWSDTGPDSGDRQDHRVARTRTLRSGILTSLLSKGVGALGPLLLLPITLNYVGKEAYGVWMTVMALTSMLLWADLGLGNGLMTRLSHSYANRDTRQARELVSTGYALLVAGSLGFVVLLWSLSGLVPWTSLVGAASGSNDGVVAISLVCLTAFAINIPLSLIHRIQYASQQMKASNLWQAIGSLAAVPLAWAAVEIDAGTPAVVAAAVGAPLLVNALNSAYVYLGPGRDIAPSPRQIRFSAAAGLSRLGGQFFAISVLSSISMNVDNLIIAHTVGLEAVTEYAVPARVFLLLALLITVVNMPFWPASGDALARGDHEWIRATARRLTLLTGGILVVGSVVLVLLARPILARLTSGVITAEPALLIAIAAGWLVVGTSSPWFTVQNAAGYARPQIVGWAAFLVVGLSAKWAAATLWGVPAMVAAGVLAYLIILAPTAAFGYRRVMRTGAGLAPLTPDLTPGPG